MRPRRRRSVKTKGQVSIMVAMMLTTFFLFFLFVVHTGLLINAKINLQNAADMAAYSGAASQARILNQIGILNYEMRRQFKKFLFRYYVVGNMSQTSHTVESQSGQGNRSWAPNADEPGKTYRVPAVCMIYNLRDNFCKQVALEKLAVVPVNPLDGLSATLNAAGKAIESARQNNCFKIAWANFQTLNLWLYNTDPTLQGVIASMRAMAAQSNNQGAQIIANSVQGIQAVAQGIGLVPRQVILIERIRTLQKYANFAAQLGLDSEGVEALQNSGEAPMRERPIQAYLSAYNTLGEHTFPGGDIKLDELMPSGGLDGSADVLKLKTLTSDFETYFVGYPNIQGGNYPSATAAIDPENNPRGCEASPIPMQIRGLPVGVEKDPSSLTYYAVRLRAKAKLLGAFGTALGTVDLEAYSAAQPFGSRIGPQADSPLVSAGSTAFVNPNGIPQNPNNPGQILCAAGACSGTPNLPVSKGDNFVNGWNQNLVIKNMFGEFSESGGSPGADGAPIRASMMGRALHSAMAPNPVEAGKYNILYEEDVPPNDADRHETAGDPFERYFDDQLVHEFWAPVVPADNVSGADPSRSIQEMIANSSGGAPEFKEELARQIVTYIGKLRQCQGEDIVPGVKECFNIAQISDPLRRKEGTVTPVTMGDGVLMRGEANFKTGWADVRDGNIMNRRRGGYSVKFVNFGTLLNPRGLTSNGEEGWANVPQAPSDATDAFNSIKH
ncbi:MAG: pilus assembly protein TadG-related protein [Bacteriovoracia bacterium]